MKRFSIFCAALFAAATSFATVTYELNGGVTNDDNWLNKGEMFQACMTDAGVTTLASLDELKAAGEGSLGTICTPLGASQCQAILDNAKWDWMEAYIMQVQNADLTTPATQLTEGVSSAGWRYAIAAFFLEMQRTGWPKSADFSAAGKPEAFIPAWKHAFANPTEPTAEFVLNAPYKEGYTFDGWYATADFSGEKVLTVNAETTGTLYAKWIEYVPTIAEVWAMEEGVETKISGVVNWVRKNNVFIQDATGGYLLYGKDLAPEVGTKIIAKGTRGSFNGKPQLSNTVIESSEAGELAAPVVTTLGALLADTTSLMYFGQRVSVLGVYVAEYDSYGNLWVAEKDGSNKIQCYYMTPDQATYPVGAKISLTAVASSNKGKFQFEGDIAGIELVVVGKKDTYEYPERAGGRYTLTNNWVISNNEDNFAANKPGNTDYVRGMAVKDGKMYFINRETASITVVDGATAEMLDPIKITGENLYCVQKEDGTWASNVTLAYNDIKFDQAGNCLIGACVSASASCENFFVYKVDLETGVATEVINENIWATLAPDSTAFRFDAFGVNGDVNGNACIMAADANGSWNVYKWLITNGEAGSVTKTTMIVDETQNTLYGSAAGFGTAPQIFPQDEVGSLFYVDGFYTLPMLFDENGYIVDDFINVPAGAKVTNQVGDVLSMNTGHNGLIEFQVGEDYFLLMTASNTAASVTSSFALYKFADDARMFEEMEPLWYFPANGMGSATNGCRTAVPSVEVDGNTAKLYLYTNNNGYACYTLTIKPEIGAALEDVEAAEVGARKVVENGQVYIIKNGVKFNVLGAEVK